MKLILAAYCAVCPARIFAGSKVLAAGAKDPKADRPVARWACASCHGEDGKGRNRARQEDGHPRHDQRGLAEGIQRRADRSGDQNGLKRNKDGKAQRDGGV